MAGLIGQVARRQGGDVVDWMHEDETADVIELIEAYWIGSLFKDYG